MRTINITVTKEDVKRAKRDVWELGLEKENYCPISCAIKRHMKNGQHVHVCDNSEISIGNRVFSTSEKANTIIDNFDNRKYVRTPVRLSLEYSHSE